MPDGHAREGERTAARGLKGEDPALRPGPNFEAREVGPLQDGIGRRLGRIALALSRRPGMVAGAFALVGLLWGLGPGAGLTDAARYTVAQCGWKVGNDGGWYQSAANKFHSSSWCGVPEGSDAWDGVHVTSGTRPSTQSTSGTRFARWRWQAPAGTGIVTVEGDRWHVLRSGFRHRLGHATPNGAFSPFADFTTSDTTRRHFSKAFSPHAEAFESRLLCAKPERSACLLDGTALAGVRGVTFTLDDPSRPVPSVSDLPAPGAWVRGVIPFRFAASDTGAGLKGSSSSVDGAVFARTDQACSEKVIAGQLRATRMRPCTTQAAGSHQIDTARLADGLHNLDHCASDFAGNLACVGSRTLQTDNNPPSAPRRLAVEGGDDWRKENGFALSWENPDQGVAAPITAAHFRVSGPGGYARGPERASSTSAIESLEVPAAGEYQVAVWIEDAAGNTNPAADATATIRFDDMPPSARLAPPSPSDPDLISVPVSDLHSGVAGGTIEIRHQSSDEWEGLVTGFEQGQGLLTADFSSERRTPGRWQVRVRASDRAGNSVLVDRLPDGSPLELIAPARTETELVAGLAGRGGPTASLVVSLGRPARVQGRLTDRSGRGLGEQVLRIVESPVADSPTDAEQTTRTATTGPEGGFTLDLPAGSSRRIKVHFAGTRRLMSSSSGPLELAVRAGVSFSAKPRRLRTGEVIRFRGAIRPRSAARRFAGNLVEIQYLETASRRWRPALVTRVRSHGSFRARYRFRYLSRPTRIRFRARMLAAPGLPFATGISKAVRVLVTGR